MIINRLVNMFKKDKSKNKIDYRKFGMGCIPSEPNELDMIYEVELSLKDKKCGYYKDRYEKDAEYRRRINQEFLQNN